MPPICSARGKPSLRCLFVCSILGSLNREKICVRTHGVKQLKITRCAILAAVYYSILTTCAGLRSIGTIFEAHELGCDLSLRFSTRSL